MTKQIPLARYLFIRLAQLGVESIHGVPGDFNLTLLDYIVSTGLQWVGNCNELNAGYAADGYARIKSLGALVTTFGVGELSAINAVAGAYSERVPVVHIVGTPARNLQHQGVHLHHTLNDGQFRHFAQMYSHVSVAQLSIWDRDTSAKDIDAILMTCLAESRPVYIEIPTDLVDAEITAWPLKEPLADPRLSVHRLCSTEEADEILDIIYRSDQHFILVDGETDRLKMNEEVNAFIEQTRLPTAVTPFGKGIVDESFQNFHGVYSGKVGRLQYDDYVKACDLIFCFGPHFTSTNSYGFSTVPDADKTIEFGYDIIRIGRKLSPSNLERILKMSSKAMLALLVQRLDVSKIRHNQQSLQLPSPRSLLNGLPPTNKSSSVDQDTFYLRMSHFFREGDIILAETGTIGHGCREFILPKNAAFVKPVTWLSIGYMLPAAQGAAMAERDHRSKGHTFPRRTILFQGDGSFQMTVQEVSTIIRHKLDVIIFLINNGGYTIERMIHGKEASYNDVANWRYLSAGHFFGADKALDKICNWTVSTWGELEAALVHPDLTDGTGLRMVEVKMARDDAPRTLKILTGWE